MFEMNLPHGDTELGRQPDLESNYRQLFFSLRQLTHKAFSKHVHHPHLWASIIMEEKIFKFPVFEYGLRWQRTEKDFKWPWHWGNNQKTVWSSVRMVQSTPFRWNLAGAGGEDHCSGHQVQLGDHAQLGELHSETITVTQQHPQIKAKDDQKPKILEWSHSLGLLNFGKEKEDSCILSLEKAAVKVGLVPRNGGQ